jgi:mRNA interferase RelE/StbE
MQWEIIIMAPAKKQLKAILDRRIRQSVMERIEALKEGPEQQGKPLTNELAGLRSVRAVGQRYRIIYRVDAEQIVVLVLTVGLRREGDRADIYALTKRLLRLGLLDLE